MASLPDRIRSAQPIPANIGGCVTCKWWKEISDETKTLINEWLDNLHSTRQGVDNPTTVTLIHGHQWRRGKGMDWWAGQAHGGHPAGGSTVLQCGHYHGWHIETSATKTLIQSPTFDLGSPWFTEQTGAISRRGGLVYLLNAGEVSRMSVV